MFGIPLEELARAFTLEEGKAGAMKVKELETIFPDSGLEVGTSSVRLFVAWYKGLPFELKEESFLPAPASAILGNTGILSQEQVIYLQSHTLAAGDDQ